MDERAISTDAGRALAERLVERETFHHAVLDGIELGIAITDAFGAITFLNRAALAGGNPVNQVAGLPAELTRAELNGRGYKATAVEATEVRDTEVEKFRCLGGVQHLMTQDFRRGLVEPFKLLGQLKLCANVSHSDLP